MDKDLLRIESLQDPDEKRMVVNERLVGALGATGAKAWWAQPNMLLAGHVPEELWHHESSEGNLQVAIANAAVRAGEASVIE